MPSGDTRVLLSEMKQALSNSGFVQAIEHDGVAIWDCHFEPGAEVVLDQSQDWLVWDDVENQLIEQGFPTHAIASYLDSLMECDDSPGGGGSTDD